MFNSLSVSLPVEVFNEFKNPQSCTPSHLKFTVALIKFFGRSYESCKITPFLIIILLKYTKTGIVSAYYGMLVRL
jgi:hypothetical protein